MLSVIRKLFARVRLKIGNSCKCCKCKAKEYREIGSCTIWLCNIDGCRIGSDISLTGRTVKCSQASRIKYIGEYCSRAVKSCAAANK